MKKSKNYLEEFPRCADAIRKRIKINGGWHQNNCKFQITNF